MNVLFLTLVEINSLDDRGIYQDLLNEFIDQGHQITIVTPVERRRKVTTRLIESKSFNLLQVKTLNIQKTNLIEKGIGTLIIEYQYLNAIKKYLDKVKFDLVLYSTPPITFSKVISYVKCKDNAFSYLLLKDIFPQNAVDMEMIKDGGLIHRFFIKKEKRLYSVSDAIGCMSEANVKYLLKNNPEIPEGKVEVNPNSIKALEYSISELEKKDIRAKYNIPLDKRIFVYGGNLGKPQGLDFLLEVIDNNVEPLAYFLIIGNGTEYEKVFEWFEIKKPKNAKLMKGIHKRDYDILVSSCDVGLIFLDGRFTIPNFPSRLLSYLEMGLPVIAATDSVTDIGDVIEEFNCGYKVISGDMERMVKCTQDIFKDDIYSVMKLNAKRLLEEKYLVNYSYSQIKNRVDV